MNDLALRIEMGWILRVPAGHPNHDCLWLGCDLSPITNLDDLSDGDRMLDVGPMQWGDRVISPGDIVASLEF